MSRSSKLPKDANHLAAEIVRLSTEEPPESVKEYLARIGRKGGIKGGPARARKLTSEQRTKIAKTAAAKRWKKSN